MASEVSSGHVDAGVLPAAGECMARPREVVGLEGDPVAVTVLRTPTRPIGSAYHHPRPARLHAGHRRRMDGYIRGGLTGNEVARLTGVDAGYVRYRRMQLRLADARAAGRVGVGA